MIKFSKLRQVKSPERGTPKSAGIDFFIPEGEEILIPPRGYVLIGLGVKVKLPEGYSLIFENKSGVATKKNLIVGACVIDEDYQGELMLHLINTKNLTVELTGGEKIVQGIVVHVPKFKLEEVPENELYEAVTVRGDKGFGSTGDR